ncbi:hypothetical protein INT45_010365 [Circinella minor]|uniref:Mid2 domain-containing protein n=1 Tax=Circinella minor TaxID=1195481 RepID=A0A8H7SCJ3_9FUNG|nr:hypothetical protein INT45_010365 [Circinella minor]
MRIISSVTTTASLLLLLPSVVLSLKIQRPLPHTLQSAGLDIPLSWTVDPGESITSLKVMLAQPENTIVATLAENVDATKGSPGIKIPKETVNGEYYIVLEGNNTPPTRATQGPFTVIFGSSSSSAGPSSSASASASSSASASASASSSGSITSGSRSASSSSSASKTSSDNESSSTSTSDEAQESTDETAGSNNSLESGQIAGIVVGVVGAGLVAGLAAFFVFVRRRKRNNNNDTGKGADEVDYYNNESNSNAYVIDAPQPRYGPPPPTTGYRNMNEPYNEPYNTMGAGVAPYNEQQQYNNVMSSGAAPYNDQQQYNMSANAAAVAGVTPYSEPYNNMSKTYQPSEAVATAGSYTMSPSTPTTVISDKPHSAV